MKNIFCKLKIPHILIIALIINTVFYCNINYSSNVLIPPNTKITQTEIAIASLSQDLNIAEIDYSEVNADEERFYKFLATTSIPYAIDIDFIFDQEYEYKNLQKFLGSDMNKLQNTIFIGNSHAHRLIMIIGNYVKGLYAKGNSTLAGIKSEVLEASKSLAKNAVIIIGYNDVYNQTSLNLFDEYIKETYDILKAGGIQNIYFCSYIRVNVGETKYGNDKINIRDIDYDLHIRDACQKYKDLHYINLFDFFNKKYIEPDNHYSAAFSRLALIRILKSIKND